MLNRRICAAVVLLLVVGQFFTVLHAAESGDETHSHDCVICVANPSEEELDTILPLLVDRLGVNSTAESQPTLFSPAPVVFTR